MMPSLRTLTLIFASLALITSSLAVNAPVDFPWLWVVKGLSMGFSGIALMLVNPDVTIANLTKKAPP